MSAAARRGAAEQNRSADAAASALRSDLREYRRKKNAARSGGVLLYLLYLYNVLRPGKAQSFTRPAVMMAME